MVVAAQLWIFTQTSDWAERSPDLLRELAEAGYDSVEAMFGQAPQDRETMQAAGIAYGAAHLLPPNIEELEPLTDFLQSMNARHVCCSGPLRWNERTADDYRRTAAFLNEKGRRLREQGIRLHYHNHEFEFEKVTGEQTAMDLLLTEFNPNSVTLCFDAGWAQRAGQDAATFLREHGPRVGVLHLRDFRGTQSVPLGQGEINLPSQIALLPHLPNLAYAAIEQDPSPNPLADMQASRRHLRNAFGL